MASELDQPPPGIVFLVEPEGSGPLGPAAWLAKIRAGQPEVRHLGRPVADFLAEVRADDEGSDQPT
jgi:hypothetical protein